MSFEQMLAKYAEITVHIGLGLKPGQRLVIRAPLESAPFVRLVTASAYRAGCRYVDVMWSDERVELARFQYAPRDSFEEFPAYKVNARIEYARSGAASLSIHAEDPDLLKDQDPEHVETVMRTYRKHGKPFLDLLQRNLFNWCVVSIPIPSWTAKVFPDLPAQEAEDKLWQAIFQVCRLDQPDPVQAWKNHITNLSIRSRYLNEKRYVVLRLKGPGTDLKVGLPEGHIWVSGQSTSVNGISYVANMPTEEIFTLPHKHQVDGYVSSTRPFGYAGNLIDDFRLTFEKGKVVSFHARLGENLLRKLLDSDEGARYLGELALVPHSSPVSQSNILFFNTLFDENAASHLALGSAYKETIQKGETMTDEEFSAAGGNDSQVHEDFMFGSSEIDIDGILADGSQEPVMRQGEWAFSA